MRTFFDRDTVQDFLIQQELISAYLKSQNRNARPLSFTDSKQPELEAEATRLNKENLLKARNGQPFRAIFPDSPDEMQQRLTNEFIDSLVAFVRDSAPNLLPLDVMQKLARQSLKEYVRLRMEAPLV